MPSNPDESARIAMAAITGTGSDVIQMPKYFKPWAQGLPSLRNQLKTVDQLGLFSKGQRRELKERMARLGFASDQPSTLFLTGNVRLLLVVFDLQTLQIKAILRPIEVQ
jgi:hypothetical protein